MTARILRIELRRSAALLAALVSLPMVLSYSEVGQGLSTVASGLRANLAEGFIPLLLGLGAWQARRDRRSRTEELFGTTPRPRWQRLLPPAAALSIGAVVGLALVFTGLAGYAGAVGAYVSAVSVPFTAVTALYLVAAVCAGLAIGRLLPWVLTPPLLVVFGFVAMAVLMFNIDDEGPVPKPGTVLLVPGSGRIGHFYAVGWQVLLAQALWAVALVVAGLLLYAGSRSGRLAAPLPVALAVVLVVPMLPGYAYQASTFDLGARAMVCTSDSPKICVTKVPGQARDVYLGGRGLLLVPSVFCRTPCGSYQSVAEPDSPVVLFYPALRTVTDAYRLWSPGHPRSTSKALAALLGATRAVALEALGQGCTTTELARRLDIAAATASHHATILRDAGLIWTRRHGSGVLHTVTPLGLALLNGDRQRAATPSATSDDDPAALR